MAEVGMEGVWDLVDAISPKDASDEKRSSAEVTRVDQGGTVWVHLPGGAEETPIDGLSTSEVRPGDTVQVVVENGRASLVGNATSPAVGYRQVTETVAPVKLLAERSAGMVQEAFDASENAEELAKEAKAVADATGQHFWSDDDGAHVTEVTQEEWNDEEGTSYHSGPNSLWNSLGMLFRNGLNNLLALVTGTNTGVAIYDGEGNEASNIVASFSADGQVIGKVDDSHLSTTYRSIELIDKDGVGYFTVGDLRVRDGYENTDSYRVYGTAAGYTVTTQYPINTDADMHVFLNGSETQEYTVRSDMTVEVRGLTLGEDNDIRVTYFTQDIMAKYYTLGTRQTGATGINSAVIGTGVAEGPYSYAEGYQTRASGPAAHAEGYSTTAYSNATHAEGKGTTAYNLGAHAEGEGTVAIGQRSHTQNHGTIARGNDQTALGRYNEDDATSALILGNGTADDARSNALTVDWSGNIWAAGKAVLTGAIEAASAAITGAITAASATISGDIQAGTTIIIRNDNADTTASTLDANQWWTFGTHDKNGKFASWWQTGQYAAGNLLMSLVARRVVNGANVDHGMWLTIASDGTRSVRVSDADAWRDALDAVETNTERAWVYADTFANAQRLFLVGATVDNTASQYNGREVNLYTRTTGLFCYVNPKGSQAAETLWSLNLPSGTTNLDVQSGTVTRGSSASTLGSVSLRKYGNVVTLIVSGMKLAGNLNSGVTSGTVATVPAGWRPPMTYRTALINNSTGNFGNAWVVVGSGGVIQVANRSQTQLTTAHELSFTATYIV